MSIAMSFETMKLPTMKAGVNLGLPKMAIIGEGSGEIEEL